MKKEDRIRQKIYSDKSKPRHVKRRAIQRPHEVVASGPASVAASTSAPVIPSKTTSWGGVAGWYDNLLEKNDGTFQKDVILPNLLRLIGPLGGKRVLDLACGQGFFSRAFAEAGASVMASDISAELIDFAKKHSITPTKNAGQIQYFVSSANNAQFCPPATADVVTIILAIQNIDDLTGTIAEASRALKRGGRLLIVMNHPAFRIPKRTSWQWDDKQSRQYRRVDSYMSDTKEMIEMNPGAKSMYDKKVTFSFHRPLQTYFKVFQKSGLAVTRLEEWISHRESKQGPRGDEENRIRKEIPMFLCFEATKLN